MLSLIYKANSSYEKVTVLSDFLDKYHMIVMLYRVNVELHVIIERQYACIAYTLQKIGKQATGRYLENSIHKAVVKKNTAICLC